MSLISMPVSSLNFFSSARSSGNRVSTRSWPVTKKVLKVFDGALSCEAASHKGIISDVAGNADILLFHNIEAGNSTYKSLTIVAGCLLGGVVMGASAPIVLTSRSDSPESKLFSIALARASI